MPCRRACAAARRCWRRCRAEAADQARLPPAQLRDTDRVLPRGDHAERRVLRALPPLRHPRRDRQAARPENVERGGRRRGRERTALARLRRSQGAASRRAGRGQSMLGQPARVVHAARARRRMGLRRHGLRALERRPAQGRARQDRPRRRRRVEISLERRRRPAVDKTPDFIKSIPVWKAIEDSTIIAYEMNGQPLPHLNSAPASSCSRAGSAPTG